MILLFGIGGFEIMIVVVAVLLLFGSKRLPEFMRTFGKGMREFRKATDDIKREINDHTDSLEDDIKDFKENLSKED